MIFPKKKPGKKEEEQNNRIRLFNNGGGLGLNFIARKPVLPDVEGVSMMLQNDAEIEQGIAKARAGIHALTEMDEDIKPGDFKDSAGQFNTLKGQFNQAYSEWLQKYGQGDEIFSPESKSKIRDLQSIFSLENLATVNAKGEQNKQEYDQMQKNRLGDNLFIGQNGEFMISNPDSPEGVSLVSEEQYYDPELKLNEKYRPMTQQQVSDWKRQNMRFGSSIDVNVGTGKRYDEVVKTIGESFNGLGHNQSGTDSLFASTLAKEARAQGLELDNTKPLFGQIKSKIKDNNRQVQAAITLAAKSLSQEDRNAIKQEMVKQGIQPNHENLSEFLGKIITGEASKNRIFEQDTDLSYKNINAIGSAEDQMRQDFTSFVINNPIGVDGGNGEYVISMPGAFKTNVKAGDKTIPAGAVRIRNDERKKELVGDTPAKPVRNQSIYIDGQKFMHGTGAPGESQDESLSALRMFWTGDVQEIVEIPPNEVTGQKQSSKRLRRSIVVHEDDAKELMKRMGMDLEELEGRGVATRIDQDADESFKSLTDLGIPEATAKRWYDENERGMNPFGSLWSGDKDMIVINVEEEISNAELMQRVSNTERVEGYMNRREGDIDAIGNYNKKQTEEVDNLYDN